MTSLLLTRALTLLPPCHVIGNEKSQMQLKILIFLRLDGCFKRRTFSHQAAQQGPALNQSLGFQIFTSQFNTSVFGGALCTEANFELCCNSSEDCSFSSPGQRRGGGPPNKVIYKSRTRVPLVEFLFKKLKLKLR